MHITQGLLKLRRMHIMQRLPSLRRMHVVQGWSNLRRSSLSVPYSHVVLCMHGLSLVLVSRKGATNDGANTNGNARGHRSGNSNDSHALECRGSARQGLALL